MTNTDWRATGVSFSKRIPSPQPRCDGAENVVAVQEAERAPRYPRNRNRLIFEIRLSSPCEPAPASSRKQEVKPLGVRFDEEEPDGFFRRAPPQTNRDRSTGTLQLNPSSLLGACRSRHNKQLTAARELRGVLRLLSSRTAQLGSVRPGAHSTCPTWASTAKFKTSISPASPENIANAPSAGEE